MSKIKNFFALFLHDKNESMKKEHEVLKKAIFFIGLFFVILISYELFYKLGRASTDNLQTIRTLMIIIPILCFGLGCYLKGKNKLNVKTLCFLILLAGFSMRIGYAFYTGVNTRQHDVEMFNGSELNLNGHGHFSYIYTIFSTGKLPSKIEWQFYHPPLWHSLVALFMKVMQLIHPSYNVEQLFNESIVVSSYVACLTLYGFKELLFTIFYQKDENDLKFKNNIIIVLCFFLLAFHSQFFVMAGWMNNEGLAFLFMAFSLLYGIKFHINRKFSDIILCALMLGLGATSKISAALICLPLGFIFLMDLIDDLKQKKYNILLKALVFIVIVLPIATWFPIRNLIKFNDPSISVPGIDPYNNSLGVVQYSYWQRFGIPNIFKGINESVFCILRPNENAYQDYNVWMYTFKCSVFGEYNYWQGDIFAYFLLVFNILISLFSLFCMFYVFIKERKEKGLIKIINIAMIIIFIMSIISYIIFQILYPVTCTQDFRYMTLILLPGTYFVAKYYTLSKYKIMRIITLSLIIGFVAFSILYFISCR